MTTTNLETLHLPHARVRERLRANMTIHDQRDVGFQEVSAADRALLEDESMISQAFEAHGSGTLHDTDLRYLVDRLPAFGHNEHLKRLGADYGVVVLAALCAMHRLSDPRLPALSPEQAKTCLYIEGEGTRWARANKWSIARGRLEAVRRHPEMLATIAPLLRPGALEF